MLIKKMMVLLGLSVAMGYACAGFVDNRTTPGTTQVDAMYKSVPIEDLVIGLVPPSYGVTYTRADMPRKKVTLVSRGPWDVLLNQALKEVNLTSTINVPTRSVTISELALAPIEAAKPAETKSVTTSSTKLGRSAVETAAALPLIAIQPVWTLAMGVTVGHALRSWGEQAGWKVIWDMPKDWSVPAATSFSGDFRSAASDVIKTLAANGALVRAQFYDGNKTMVVTGPGVTAQ